MNQSILIRAIRDRVLSDIVALGDIGLAANTIVSEMGLPDTGSTSPLLIITPVALTVSPDEGFGYDMSVFEWRFDIYNRRTDGFGTLYGFQRRLYGNYSGAASGPTFGFQRHKLVLPAGTADGWAADECRFIQSTPIHDEEMLHYSDLYRVRIQRTRPAS